VSESLVDEHVARTAERHQVLFNFLSLDYHLDYMPSDNSFRN
jgi:hypothetical protein